MIGLTPEIEQHLNFHNKVMLVLMFVYLFMSRPPVVSKSPSREAVTSREPDNLSLSLLNRDLVLWELLLEEDIFLEASKLELFNDNFEERAAAAALTALAVELAIDKLRAHRTNSIKQFVKKVIFVDTEFTLSLTLEISLGD